MKADYKPTELSSIEFVLGYLVEECGEVLQAAGKSIRWGLDSVNPELPLDDQETNQDWLLREIQDLEYAIKMVKHQIASR